MSAAMALKFEEIGQPLMLLKVPVLELFFWPFDVEFQVDLHQQKVGRGCGVYVCVIELSLGLLKQPLTI